MNDFLTNDLSLASVDAGSQILRKAKVDGDSLREALRKALVVLEHSKTVLQQQGAQKKG